MATSKVKKDCFSNEENASIILTSSEKETKLSLTLQNWKEEIQDLSYEESLAELNSLLNDLQSDQASLEDIQKYYLKGKLYLAHCEGLMKVVEQEVVELDLKKLEDMYD